MLFRSACCKLAARVETPDSLVGTSAGALNAGYIAGHGTSRAALNALADIWIGLRRTDVFPVSPGRHLLALTGARESVFPSDGLRRLITRHLAYRNLEDAAIPVHVVATNVLSGEEVLLSTGDAVSAVLASTAIPGLLPAVRRDGLTLVDGALANNAAISQAMSLGADRIYVLPAGVACALAEPPGSPYASALQALAFLTQQRLIRDVADLADKAELHVLPPLCPLTVSSADFRRARELIDRARIATGKWLDTGSDRMPRPERFLSLHEHTIPPSAMARADCAPATAAPLAGLTGHRSAAGVQGRAGGSFGDRHSPELAEHSGAAPDGVQQLGRVRPPPVRSPRTNPIGKFETDFFSDDCGRPAKLAMRPGRR